MPNNIISIGAVPGSAAGSNGTWHSGPAYIGMGHHSVSIDFSLGEGGFPTPYEVDVVYWKDGAWRSETHIMTTGEGTVAFDVGSTTENVMTQPHFRVRSLSLPVEVIADPGSDDPFLPSPAPPMLPSPFGGPIPSQPVSPLGGEPKDPDSCPVPDIPLGMPPLMGPIGDIWSPLVIDLDNDGIELTNLSIDAVYWDIDNDGFKEACAWVEADDALLVMDWNDNGQIDNHGELFGTQLVDGFTKLRELDSNTDGVINSSDTLFADLKIWQDLNQDGISQSNELQTLTEAGIVSISLSDSLMYDVVEGNEITNVSTITMADTSTRDIYDAWFQYDNQNTQYAGDFDLDIRALFLPTLRGYGEVKDLYIQMSMDEGLLGKVSDLASMELVDVLSPDENFDEKFNEALYQWAGQGLWQWRGYFSDYGDSRKVGFVESIAGEKMNDVPWLGTYQMLAFYEEGLWQKIMTHYAGNFLYQTVFHDIFTGTTEYDPSLGVVTGATGLSSTAIDAVKTLIDGSDDPSYGWSLVVRTVEGVFGVDNLTVGDYDLLDDAIQDSIPGLDLDTVYNLVIGEPNDILGTSGVDTLTGTFGDDIISGIGGNDTLDGGRGDDILNGGEGNDIYIGGAGDDQYWEGSSTSNDTYRFDSGHDRIADTYGTDKIVTPTGIILSDLNIERVNIWNENDSNIWKQSDLVINVAGLGSITVAKQYDASGNATALESIEFADTSTLNLLTLDAAQMGTGGADTLTGLDRSYYLNDVIDAGEGNDTINGGLGKNYLQGWGGNDTYIYGGGLDTIFEFGGSDDKVVFDNSFDPDLFTVKFNPKYDIYTAETQNIEIYYDGELKVIVEKGLGNGDANFLEKIVIDGVQTITIASLDYSQHGTSEGETMYGFDAVPLQNNTIYGYGGNDSILARSGNDFIDGGDGNDTLQGEEGSDIIFGGAGNDNINGGANNDIIYSGSGADSLIGGTGADTFVFEADGAFDGVDVISWYSTVENDKLDISDLLIGYTSGTSDINDFAALTQNGSHMTVSVDRDGSGGTYSSQNIASLLFTSGLDVDDLLSNGNLIV